MISTESSPLIRKRKSPLWIGGACLSVLLLIAIFVYYGGNPATNDGIPNALNRVVEDAVKDFDITSPDSRPAYPTEEELEEYRANTVVIEYNLEDLPEGLDPLQFESDEVIAFHAKLIKQHGYNSRRQNIVFQVPDPVEHDEYDSAEFGEDYAPEEFDEFGDDYEPADLIVDPEYGSYCYTNFPTQCSGACCQQAGCYGQNGCPNPGAGGGKGGGGKGGGGKGGGGKGGGGKGGKGGKGSPMGPPDTLVCQTRYTGSYNQGFMELNCPSDYEITGCVSLERHTNGIRWGETAYGSSECYTHAVDTSFTSLSARCCKTHNKQTAPSGELQISTPYNQSPSPFDSSCMASDCVAGGGQAMGCTATDSHMKTDHFSGVKWVEVGNSGFDDSSGCVAQRSEKGYLWQLTYCGTVSNGGELKCKVEANFAVPHPTTGKFEARAQCSGKGYKLTDCNSYVAPVVNHCNIQSSYAFGYGINYGGAIYSGDICFATGSTDRVIAQAVCCKVA